MKAETLYNLEAEHQQPLPFAMLFAEEAQLTPVTGQYSEKAQVWEGMTTSEFANAPTATATTTHTPHGSDADSDQDWIDI